MKIVELVKIPKMALEIEDTPSAVDKIKSELCLWFGESYTNYEHRTLSYNTIFTFIENKHLDWKTSPNTTTIANYFIAELKSLTNQQLAFMLCHTGYIPEIYKADSSQETLYSKLVEVLVCEWAFRMGFSKSSLPTQKSSKEDVTIFDGENIIVCDAKSYRLGRSQAAPNVKDALKKGDITKWLGSYKSYNCIGGLVAFPSQHDWKNGSDFYLYLTDKNSPIIMLFYEHMAFMLLNNMNRNHLLDFYKNHHEIFPTEEVNKSGSKKIYFDKLEMHLLNSEKKKWSEFSLVANFITSEKARFTVDSLEEHLTLEKTRSLEWAYSLSPEQAQKELADIKYRLTNQDLIRQKENIFKFRKLLKSNT
ncbi:HindIII family type II restriction endonuclease [Serratia marcescens]|uniref:HindIII family type II restriction endonuclease n=1 Tax=Serratia marcescens TaxID=615 RepID=UPI003FA7D293